MWEKQGKTGVFVASGGQGSDEVVSEAESMRRYLTESRHVPADAVLMENRSTTTWRIFVFSKEIMDALSGVQSVPGAVASPTVARWSPAITMCSEPANTRIISG